MIDQIIKLIELLNQTSPARVLIYLFVGLLGLEIAVTALVKIAMYIYQNIENHYYEDD